MRILVIGADTFVGRNLVNYFSTCPGLVIDLWAWASDTEYWPKVINYDWVIHLGDLDHPGASARRLQLRNLHFSQWLFLQCQEAKVHLQYASTHRVYANSSAKISEYSEVEPWDLYAQTKLEFDQWVFQQRHDSYVQCFRYFDIYGKWQHLNPRVSWLETIATAAKRDQVIRIPANADHLRRDLVWVGDVCRLHLEFILNQRGSGLWNVGSGYGYSLAKIAHAMAEKLEVPLEVTSDISPLPQKIIADISHLKETTTSAKQWQNVIEWISQ
jgi:nucleoside-diphosphate-sugar epimerase